MHSAYIVGTIKDAPIEDNEGKTVTARFRVVTGEGDQAFETLCIAYGKSAEKAMGLTPNTIVVVDGDLEPYTFETESGKKNTYPLIKVSKLHTLPTLAAPQPTAARTKANAAPVGPQAKTKPPESPAPINYDDIPF